MKKKSFNIFDRVKYYLGLKTKPVCFDTSEFICCYCGKCKQKDYELPKDLQKLMAIDIVKRYKNTPLIIQ